jgi:ABC-type sugar transport system ATPase subunit
VVLRHGRITGTRAAASTSHEEIVGLITGDLDTAPAPRASG